MPPTPRSICQAWLEAVNAKDLDALTALYAEDASLTPTFSPHTARDSAGVRGYFERLAIQPGMEVVLHDATFRERFCGPVCIATGIYCFRIEIDGVLLGFEARFTFVLDPGAGRPILHHHSSQIPRNLS